VGTLSVASHRRRVFIVTGHDFTIVVRSLCFLTRQFLFCHVGAAVPPQHRQADRRRAAMAAVALGPSPFCSFESVVRSARERGARQGSQRRLWSRRRQASVVKPPVSTKESLAWNSSGFRPGVSEMGLVGWPCLVVSGLGQRELEREKSVFFFRNAYMCCSYFIHRK
jgi:hypothetical protein